MQTNILPYTPVLIRLLKGQVEYTDKTIWEKLLQHRYELTVFLQTLGLSLVLNDEDGYAYLKQTLADEEETAIGWVQRRALTYEESVLLVLLRDMMADFETGDATTRELIRKRREIKEYAELFFKEKASRVKFLKEIDRQIDKAVDNGFLELCEKSDISDEERFRIKKIIKDKVGGEELEAFKEQLQQFAQQKKAGKIDPNS
jgi:hypothetical protein